MHDLVILLLHATKGFFSISKRLSRSLIRVVCQIVKTLDVKFDWFLLDVIYNWPPSSGVAIIDTVLSQSPPFAPFHKNFGY